MNTPRQLPAGHDELTRAVRKWGDAASIETYLELMGEVLQALDLPNQDPRLVTSVPKAGTRYLLPLTVGNRYVWAFHISTETAFVILPRAYTRGHALCEQTGYFRALPGERDVPPALGYIRDWASFRANEEIQRDWKTAALAEVTRLRSSTFKRYHNPALYHAARDPAYRAVVFDQAFLTEDEL